MQHSLSKEEINRLKELYRLQILDTPAEKDFDDISKLASQVCNMPISYISLIDADRQWMKSTLNISIEGDVSRSVAICGKTIEQDKVLEISDCTTDDRYSDLPFVRNHPNIRYYAGAPLTTSNGYNIGTLCVCDVVPRKLSKEQIEALEVLSRHVINLMELRVKNQQLIHMSETQNRIISIIGHDIRNPLSSFRVMLNMQQDPSTAFEEDELQEMNGLLINQLDNTLELLNNLVQWGKLQMKIKDNQPQQVNFELIATRSLRDIQVAASMKGNILHKELKGDTIIEGDDAAIEFILRNLLSNANKFTENGKIVVSCDVENARPRISVTDSGIGMTDTEIYKVLNETGTLISSGTQNERGSGIGLSLVREFLAKCNSQLCIESQPGEGTTVSFQL